MSTATQVKNKLSEFINSEKAAFFPRFFKTGKGEYGEGDKFMGVTVPNQRIVAKKFKTLSLNEIETLLYDPIHECRLTSILILVLQFEKGNDAEKKLIYDFYLKHIGQVNNWDLVDSSAHKIVGAHLFERPRLKLYQLAKTKHLWSQRIAIVATYWFIKRDDFDDILAISDLLLNHEHDLIHKAIGWMLREMGKRDVSVLQTFLQTRYKKMPRTMLRYSIEKFDKPERDRYLLGKV